MKKTMVIAGVIASAAFLTIPASKAIAGAGGEAMDQKGITAVNGKADGKQAGVILVAENTGKDEKNIQVDAKGKKEKKTVKEKAKKKIKKEEKAKSVGEKASPVPYFKGPAQ